MPATKDPRPEQERVTEAYENISKRLEALRNGEDPDDDKPKKKSNNDEEDTAPTADFEEIEEEREELLVTENKKNSDEDEDDEIDPLDDEETEDDEDDLPDADDDDPLDEEDETPLQKKGDKVERDEETFDDVDELDGDKFDDLPKETLSERGEKLKEAEEEKSDMDKAVDDKYQWKSFQKEADEEAPKKLDDLTSESDDEIDTNSQDDESDMPLRSDFLERPTNPSNFKEEDDLPIPKIHHGSSSPSAVLGGEERRGGLNSRPSYHQDIRPSFGSDYGSRQDFNMNPKPKSSKWHLIILCLIGLAVIGGTVYLLKNQFGGSSSDPSPSPSAVAISTPEPTPTPLPTLAPAEFKVRVLNGTSTTGLAADVMDKFKELGYQTDRTGNATNSAFTTTFVRVKEGSSSANLLEQVIKALSPDYKAQSGPALKANDTADVEVILGK